MYDPWEAAQEWLEKEASALEAAAFAGWCSGAIERGARATMAKEQQVVLEEALADIRMILFPGETPSEYPTRTEARLSDEGCQVWGHFYKASARGWRVAAGDDGDSLDWSFALAVAARMSVSTSTACKSMSWPDVGRALEGRHLEVAKWVKLSEQDFNEQAALYAAKRRVGALGGYAPSPVVEEALSNALWGLRRVAELCDGGDELVAVEAEVRDGWLYAVSLQDQEMRKYDCSEWVGGGCIGELVEGPLKWAQGLGVLVGKSLGKLDDPKVLAKLEAMCLDSAIVDPKTERQKASL